MCLKRSSKIDVDSDWEGRYLPQYNCHVTEWPENIEHHFKKNAKKACKNECTKKNLWLFVTTLVSEQDNLGLLHETSQK